MAFALDKATWPIRIPVTIPLDASSAGGVLDRVTVTIPPTLSLFWDNVDSNGYFIDFANASGELLDWDRSSWTYATRTGVLRFEITTNASTSDGDVQVAYLYLTLSGVDPGGGDRAATLTGTPTTDTGTIPGSTYLPPAGAVVTAAGGLIDDDGTIRPADKYTVPVGGTTLLVITVDDSLMRNVTGEEYNGSTETVGVDWLEWSVVDATPSDLGGWYTTSSAVVLAGETPEAIAVMLPVAPDSTDEGMVTLTIHDTLGNSHRRYVWLVADTPSVP